MRIQIGQCRIDVDTEKTKMFYSKQPRITENCACNFCSYFENEVISQPNRLFEILRVMSVDLKRQPDLDPAGLDCFDTRNNQLSYKGYYFVFGKIVKTTKKTAVRDENNTVTEIGFNETEFGPGTLATIKQIDEDKLVFEFYVNTKGISG